MGLGMGSGNRIADIIDFYRAAVVVPVRAGDEGRGIVERDNGAIRCGSPDGWALGSECVDNSCK